MTHPVTYAYGVRYWPLVEFLLCAADLARQGYERPLSLLLEGYYNGGGKFDGDYNSVARLAFDAREEALAVTPHVFDYRGELLAETLQEAAYRVAEGRGAC